MILNLASLSFNLNIQGGGGTPSWGTEMGQSKDYHFDFEGMGEFLTAMLNKSIQEYTLKDKSKLYCALGKGGEQQDNFKLILASHFDKIFVNGEHVEDAEFILLIIENNKEGSVHRGRRTLKYGPSIIYQKKEINKDCFEKIESQLGASKESGWFINEIQVKNQEELHFFAFVVDCTSFRSLAERRKVMTEALEKKQIIKDEDVKVQKVDEDENFCPEQAQKDNEEINETGHYLYHYTSLESAINIINYDKVANSDFFVMFASRADCLNDPSENKLGQGLMNDLKQPYIISFCKSQDNPVMWRLYNAKVQFHFDKNVLVEHFGKEQMLKTYAFKDVKYYDFRKGNSFKHDMDKTDNPQLNVRPFSKFIDYQIENEWRIAVFDNTEEEEVHVASEKYQMVRLSKRVWIPKNAVTKITIYEFDTDRCKAIMRQLKILLNKNGFKNVELQQTQCAVIRTA